MNNDKLKNKIVYLIIILRLSMLLIIFQISNVNSQTINDSVKVREIVIVDSSLYSILDTILELESKCTYFTDSLYFGIWQSQFQTQTGDTLNGLMISGNSQNGLFIRYPGKLLGYFIYRSHCFFVRGENLFPDHIKPTDNFKIFITTGIPDILDDSWAMYYIAYQQKHFFHFDTAHNFRCNHP